jgi:hypothetical protein
MKDAIITIRVPTATRRRIQRLARRDGRSLSQQVERLIVLAMDVADDTPKKARPLSGILQGGSVPDIAGFRRVRVLLSSSLLRRTRRRDYRRR